MSKLAVDILNRQVIECQIEVENLKIKIADCAIKAHSTEPKEVHLIMNNLNQMGKLIEQVRPKEATLEQLTKAKSKLEEALEQEKEFAKAK